MYLAAMDSLGHRVLESIDSSIVVADARAADLPIVYANEAFEHLTGYARSEVIGRNCRFLQGRDTDQPGLHAVRRALADKTSVRALIRNYRKDGSLFYNELFINPVVDGVGEVTHFCGVLNVVSNPRDQSVRIAAERGYSRLTQREREVFQLLANGLSNKQVALQLGISPRTAEAHRAKVLKTLDATSLTTLVRYAAALDLPFKACEHIRRNLLNR